jgi:tetratricopeptide (TPR) repeat protein
VERAHRADEVVALAEDIGWVDLQVEAHNWRATALEELGDHDGARRDVAILTAWAAQSRRPFFQGLAHLRRTSAALRDGDLVTVDALLADPPSEAATSPNFASGFGAQLFFTERWRGTSAALVPALRDAVAATPAIPAWRAPLALAVAAAGDFDAARREIAEALAITFPCDWLWLAAHVVLADAAIYTGDASAARCLYDRLASHAEHNVVLAHGVVSFGSASRALGGLAGVLGRYDEAEHHLRVALRANTALGARPEIAATQIELANVLVRREDRAAAGALLADAVRTVDECGLAGLRARLDFTVWSKTHA